MARRNMMNERYQSGKEPTGTTRKSAASAKPVQRAASSVYQRSGNYKPKRKLGDRIFGSQSQEELDAAARKESKAAARAAKVETERIDNKPERKRMTLEDLSGDHSIPEPRKDMTELERKEAEARFRNPGTPEYKRWRRIWMTCLAIGMVFVLIPVAFQYYFEGNASLQTVLMIAAMVMLIIAIGIDAVKIRPIRRAARAGIKVATNKPKTKAEKRELERKEAEERAKLEAKIARKEARRAKFSRSK